MKIKLVNAQKMAKKYPESFEVNTEEEMKVIKKGYFVKVCDGRERFWVIVTKRLKDKIFGVVNNNLLSGFPKLGDKIGFNIENVYSFMKP